MTDLLTIKSALISVYYKDGLKELAEALVARGIQLYSTGGTFSYLESAGFPATKVESLTQFPEMMDGRVKTLHPKIFGGILARRENAKDMEEARRFEVPIFDVVVVNLYPFAEHLGQKADAQSAFIDIGGPSLLRAAAKNCRSVVVASSPADYTGLTAELEAHNGATTYAFRKQMAAKTFQRTSQYDAMIASEWTEESPFPPTVALGELHSLRYGENPHQKAAWGGTPRWKFLQGKELSYNNILDAEAAVALVSDFKSPAVAIIKHNNPCGVASANEPVASLFSKALACDEKSAFGGIVAFNRPVDASTAEAMKAIFFEVVIAPGFSPEAVTVLSAKKNLRLIEWPEVVSPAFEVRRALGGWLVQDTDKTTLTEQRVVTKRGVPSAQQADLDFAWIVAKHVKSNAIVIAKDGRTLGIGAGQMSRVDAVQVALTKSATTSRQGAVLASDAFFPFRDNIDSLKGSGITAVIQPGGSQRDNEVIEACDELDLAMVFTGQRHFRH